MTSSAGERLVVVGDTLLDVDLDGTSDRLSPDAGVPVVDVGRRRLRPGGAGMAALLAARAGVEVTLVTALGSDPAGRVVRELLEDYLSVQPLPLSGSTVCKTRVRAGGVSLVRLDWGTGVAADVAVPEAAAAAVGTAPAVLVADYGRGVAGLAGVRAELAARAGAAPVVWDPHPRGPAPVAGCALVTPNQAEAAGFLGAEPVGSSAADERRRAAEWARRLAARWDVRAVAVTVGPRGAILVETGGNRVWALAPELRSVPAPARSDSCGAGDQLAVTAAARLGSGAGLVPAVQAGVDRASAYVLAGGSTAAVPHADRSEPGAGPEILGPAAETEDAFAVAERVRRSGGRLVATGGCFDLLHRGHVQLLGEARRLGDALVVCLNSDASVRRAKGAGRPVVGEEDRALVLAALAAVDAVVVFDEDTPEALLRRLRPDVWVKGADYAGRPMAEAATVRRYGGEVVFVPTRPGHSTTQLVSRARHADAPWPESSPSLESAPLSETAGGLS